jgi:hypothetical protein
MSNVGFFHETFDGQEWVSERSGRIFGTDPFLWLKTKQYDWIPLDALFFQRGALIPFRNGLPPDQPPSRLRNALAEIGGDARWLPVQDLFLDDWEPRRCCCRGGCWRRSRPCLATAWHRFHKRHWFSVA